MFDIGPVIMAPYTYFYSLYAWSKPQLLHKDHNKPDCTVQYRTVLYGTVPYRLNFNKAKLRIGSEIINKLDAPYSEFAMNIAYTY